MRVGQGQGGHTSMQFWTHFFHFCFKSKANPYTCTVLLRGEAGLETSTTLSLGFEPFGQIGGGESELLHSAQSLLCRVLTALPVPLATKSQTVGWEGALRQS